MELTRRDAAAALGVIGLAAPTAGCFAPSEDAPTESDDAAGADPDGDSSPDDESSPDDVSVDALRAAAEVLYPTDVEATDEFVETYVRGRAAVDEAYLQEVDAAYGYVDEAALDRHDERFEALAVEDRDELLREEGLHTAAPDPEADGGPEHARYYLIDELLFALYSTPEGSERAGIQNPKGHPGGTEAYQEAPE